MRRRIWVQQGDIILVGLRDFQDGKADVILKYTDAESRNLKTYGELPDTAKIGEYGVTEEGGAAPADDCAFDFEAI
jgi:translation initiation factor 1A